jgi:hypothetical protein
MTIKEVAPLEELKGVGQTLQDAGLTLLQAASNAVGADAKREAFPVRTHIVTVECLEKHRWRVSVDGRLLASFCTESRARTAGRIEARRLDFIASDAQRQ